MAKKKIVTIGGGSGQFTLLSGLRDIKSIALTAVVAMMDSGGSTGRLRDELGVLPPGDILKCLVALSVHRDVARAILLQRFTSSERLKGHNAGNMLLTMLSQYTGSFPQAIQALAEILNVRGTILPVSTVKATLVAELASGAKVYGERAIDQARSTQNERIKNIFLVPHHSDKILGYPLVIEAINNADFIIIGPGDLYTSIVPNLIVPEVKEAIKNTKAKIFFVINIMTKFGETNEFKASDFVNVLETFIEKKVDEIIVNTEKPSAEILELYTAQKSEFIEIDQDNAIWKDRSVHKASLLDSSGNIVRHNSQKLAGFIKNLIDG